jgi:hypothetical protein
VQEYNQRYSRDRCSGCVAPACEGAKVGHCHVLDFPSLRVHCDQDILWLDITVAVLEDVQLTQLVVDLVGKSRSGVVVSSQAGCERWLSIVSELRHSAASA